MARFALVRGWLECSYEEVGHIRDIVSGHWRLSSQYGLAPETADLYRAGWAFPSSPINWISLVFFGANVDEKAVDFIFDCISKIADSDIEVGGLFHIDDEGGENLRLWSIRNGVLLNCSR